MTTPRRGPKHERAKKRLMLRYGVKQPDRTAFTKNISISGLHIQTNSVLQPGTVLLIEVRFPERTILLRGRVVWARRVPPQLAHQLPCGMGVEFIDPGEEWRSFFTAWRGGKV